MLALLLSCGTEEAGSDPTEDQIAQAQAAAESAMDELQQQLSSRLAEALSNGGPEQALNVCATVAQEVTETLAAGREVALRRTALRYRNPRNAPDEFERDFMEKLEAELASGSADNEGVRAASGTALRTDNGRWEYRCLRPILLKEVCTACHGGDAQISPATRDAIALQYPDDRATGFAVGELRGAFSVRVALED